MGSGQSHNIYFKHAIHTYTLYGPHTVHTSQFHTKTFKVYSPSVEIVSVIVIV